MRDRNTRAYRPAIESLSHRIVPSTVPVIPTAYVETTPPPTLLAFNPDISRLPAPIQTDTNPISTMFGFWRGDTKVIQPPPTPPPLAPPLPTLPVLPPPLPTGLPVMP